MNTLKGIADYERTHEIWSALHDDQARGAWDPGTIASRKWDGVISRHTTPGLVKTCAELKIPLVDLNDTAPFPGVPKIRPDNNHIGHLAAEHLLERGFRHFGFTGFSNYGWSCERRDGFVEALRIAGKECDVFDVDYPGDIVPIWDLEQFSGLTAWLKDLPKPAGLMACFDVRALQIVNAAYASGILVPEEIAVIGVNNDPIRCELAFPALSSVAPNSYLSGYKAAETLSTMLEGRKTSEMDLRIEPLGVVARHSTEALAIEEKNVASALSFIRQQACHGLSVAGLVQHVHVSRSVLEKKFRRHLGRSPQAEIRRVQMAKVRQLLLESDYPLKKIAELAGFEHVEYMCVVFKRLVGASPGSYRKDKRTNTARRDSLAGGHGKNTQPSGVFSSNSAAIR